ncbi:MULTISPECIES: type IVB secretion system protein IcmW [Aeromonas]|nr:MULTISPECIES: hypothetical protein [Aeromonas]
MITNDDVEKFRDSITPNSDAVLQAMVELEDWVVDGEDAPQIRINVLSGLLREDEGLARFNGIDPALRLQALLHMNAHRFTMLLKAMSESDTSSIATLLEDQPAPNGIYVLRYLMRFIMMLRHQMVSDIFGVERLSEIRHMLELTTNKITLAPPTNQDATMSNDIGVEPDPYEESDSPWQ